MGALIGFELARLLRRNGKRQPSHLFASGCNAPQLPLTARRIFDLPEAEFIEELRRLNGTPAEVLEHAELMQLFAPIIRDDLSVCQTYEYSPDPPLDCDITAFGGVGDPGVTQDGVSAWRKQTTANFSMNMLPGDHFFVHSALPDLLTNIRRGLRDKL
ncbi:MAG TPA: thioesterase domain-containing protein [Pyrinomonadaceae bacterium]|nr:thioesterase domain-containing protein [Pyrinomonadaceae bacterium]